MVNQHPSLRVLVVEGAVGYEEDEEARDSNELVLLFSVLDVSTMNYWTPCHCS